MSLRDIVKGQSPNQEARGSLSKDLDLVGGDGVPDKFGDALLGTSLESPLDVFMRESVLGTQQDLIAVLGEDFRTITDPDVPSMTGVPSDEPEKGIILNLDNLRKLTKRSKGKFSQELIDSLNEAMQKYGITSTAAQTHFLSQIFAETAGLSQLTEGASGAAYETGTKAASLGNIKPGDGVRYKGRGPIQLTGRANYEEFFESIGLPKNSDPNIVADDPRIGAASAAWFFASRGLIDLANSGGSVEQITKIINGGLNGLDRRKKAYDHIIKNLGEDLIESDIIPTTFSQTLSFGKKGISPTAPSSADLEADELNRQSRNIMLNPLAQRNVDIADFNKYMEGADPFQDIHKLRAVNQSNFEQIIYTARTMPFRIFYAVLENVGQILDLESWANTVGEGQEDYSNWLTRFAKSAKEDIMDTSPVYREDPNAVWDPLDFAWWIEHGSNLIESIVAFYAVGAGVGSVLGAGLKGLATLANAGRYGTAAAKITQVVGTSAALTFVEGAQEAALVYDGIYQEAVDAGKTIKEAEYIASSAAVMTARKNMVNVMVNMTSSYAILRSSSAIKAFRRSPLARLSGESNANYVIRLAAQQGKTKTFGRFMAHSGFESGQESIEELVNEISSAEGYFAGRGLLGADDPRTFNERLKDVLSKPQTHLAMTLGAIGGAGQTFLTSVAPKPNRVRQSDGTIKTTWTNRYTQDRAQEEVRNTKTHKDLLGRLSRYMEDQKTLSEVAESGDIAAYRKVQNDLFALAAEDMIKSGIEEQLIDSYKEIIKLTEAEAQEQGFTTSDGPNNYKRLAQDKIDEIERLTNRWENIEAQYGFNDDERLSGLPDFVFSLEMQKEIYKNDLEKAQQQTSELAPLIHTELINQGLDPEIVSILVPLTAIAEVKIESVEDTMEQVEEDLKSPGGRQRVRNLYGTDDLVKIAKLVKQKEGESIASRQKELTLLDNAINALSKERGENVLAELKAKRLEYAALLDILAENGQYVSDSRRELSTVSSSLSRLTSGKGRRDDLSNFRAEVRKLTQEYHDNVADAIDDAPTPESVSKILENIDEVTKDSPTVAKAMDKKAAEFKVDEEVVFNEAEELGASDVMIDALREQEAAEKAPIVEKEIEVPPPNPITGEPFQGEITIRKGEEYEEPPFIPDPPATKKIEGKTRSQFLHRLSQLKSVREVDDFQDFMIDHFRVDPEFKEAMDLQKEKVRSDTLNKAKIIRAAEDSQTPVDQIVKNVSSTFEDLSTVVTTLTEDEQGREIVAGRVRMVGKKKVPAGSSLARKTLSSRRVDVEGQDISFMLAESSEAIQEFLHSESVRYNQPGDEIRLRIEEEYDKDGVTYEELINKKNYKPWETAPMVWEQKIGGQWTKMGYLHDSRWIRAYTDVDGRKVPLNVAHMMEDGSNNWQIQMQISDDVRKKLWDARSLLTSITSNTPGKLIRNIAIDEDGNPKHKNGVPQYQRDKIDYLIPDKSIEFSIIRSGFYQTAPGKNVDKNSLLNTQDTSDPTLDGQLGLIIPMGKNQNLWVPVWMPQLDGPKVDAIWMLMAGFWSNPERREIISKGINQQFDPAKERRTLSIILGSYLYSSSFDDKALRNTKERQDKIYFYVSERTGHVQIARHGDGIIYTTDPKNVDGSGQYVDLLEQDADGNLIHMKTIKKYLGQMTQHANLSYLNTQRQINHIEIRDGKIVANKKGYKDFLRETLMVDIYGRNSISHKDGSREYVYDANSVITIDHSFTKSVPLVREDDPVDPSIEGDDSLTAAFSSRPKMTPDLPILKDLNQEEIDAVFGTEGAAVEIPPVAPDMFDMPGNISRDSKSIGFVRDNDFTLDRLESEERLRIACKLKP